MDENIFPMIISSSSTTFAYICEPRYFVFTWPINHNKIANRRKIDRSKKKKRKEKKTKNIDRNIWQESRIIRLDSSIQCIITYIIDPFTFSSSFFGLWCLWIINFFIISIHFHVYRYIYLFSLFFVLTLMPLDHSSSSSFLLFYSCSALMRSSSFSPSIDEWLPSPVKNDSFSLIHSFIHSFSPLRNLSIFVIHVFDLPNINVCVFV